MKNKKGFTLIELLAVIVVLAVIMVIATQQVNGVMAKARSNSFIESYQMIVKQGKACAAQDTDPSTAKKECNYDLSDDYTLTVTCDDPDACVITLKASRADGAKFRNMDLWNYGNGKVTDEELTEAKKADPDATKSSLCAKKIGSGAKACDEEPNPDVEGKYIHQKITGGFAK